MTVPLPPLWPMALPMWPMPGSVNVTQQAGVRPFQPQRGLPIQRPGQTAALITVNLRLPPVDETAAAAFWTFYNVTLGQGALRFAWVHPLRETVREMAFVEASIPTEVDVPGGWRQIAMQLSFLDVAPGWADQVTIANGFVDEVTP